MTRASLIRLVEAAGEQFARDHMGMERLPETDDAGNAGLHRVDLRGAEMFADADREPRQRSALHVRMNREATDGTRVGVTRKRSEAVSVPSMFGCLSTRPDGCCFAEGDPQVRPKARSTQAKRTG